MNIPLFSSGFAHRVFAPHRLGRRLSVVSTATILWASSASLVAQDAAPATDAQGARRRNAAAGENAGERGDRRNMSPQDIQERLMSSMRERFEVADDEEWKLISERLTKVMELRRASGGGAGGFAGFGGRAPQGGGNNDVRAARGNRGGAGASTEVAALSTALRDKLPDAEIKARLERVREARKENESKLTKAQEELRAVLSVRQEATAVVFGLLP